MAYDAHANFAVSAVATAPSPATSGTSLVVTAGHGVRFPAVPFNATICPAATQPDPTNAEIVRVTAVSTDTLTIVRAQEGTSARTVVVGDQVFAGITAKTLTDVESAGLTADYLARMAAMPAAQSGSYWRPAGASLGTQIATVSALLLAPYPLPRGFSTDAFIASWTTAASAGGTADFAIYRAHPTTGMPDALVASVTGVATTGTNVDLVQTITPVALSADLYWIGAVAHTASPVWRAFNNTGAQSVPLWTPSVVALGGTQIRSGFVQTGVTGAPPSTFTGTATERFIPAVYARSA